MLDNSNVDFSDLIEGHKTILSIIDKHNEGKAKFVGGCVRDFIVYKTISNDIDISTILKPEKVIDLILEYKKNNKNIDCVILDKDKKYGTIVVILRNQKYEITTTRSDIACFGRQAEVELCEDFYTDSLRRDFTINAFYVGLDNKLLDFHNGIDDLNKGIIRFIGNADNRIKEDYLRIIRFFRFNTKFKIHKIDNKVMEVLKSNKNGLLKISRERIRSEIFKMLEYDNWFFGLLNIVKNNFLNEVFLLDYSTPINKIEPTFNSNNEIVKLFYFFNYNFKVMEKLKQILKFTNKESKFVDFLMLIWEKTNSGANFNIEAKMAIFYDKNNFINDTLCLFNDNIKNMIKVFVERKKEIPVLANELISKGYQGKELGDLIKKIEFEFVKSDFELTKDYIFKFLL